MTNTVFKEALKHRLDLVGMLPTVLGEDEDVIQEDKDEAVEHVPEYSMTKTGKTLVHW